MLSISKPKVGILPKLAYVYEFLICLIPLPVLTKVIISV